MNRKITDRPYTTDLSVLVDSWFDTINEDPSVPHNRTSMQNWFADVMRVGFDEGYEYHTDRNADELYEDLVLGGYSASMWIKAYQEYESGRNYDDASAR